MKYWWVNHKQTARQEIDGGYLWSPKRESGGARSQFYDNMRVATPGDFVLSFSNGLIRQLGIVVDVAWPTVKPSSFGSAGDNWDDDGWLLPVSWTPLLSAVKPKDLIDRLGPLLPMKYSPIQPLSGNGNQKAYLAEVGKAAFDLIIKEGRPDFLPLLNAKMDDSALTRVDDQQEDAIRGNTDLDSTTREQIGLARYGQGLFRKRVLERENRCRLTGIDNPALLIASHIKPWRACSTAAERLDGANGLALTPHVDRLFDRGLISFEQGGEVLLSPRLDRVDLQRLGLDEAVTRSTEPFDNEQGNFLSFHRNSVFFREN